MREMREIFERVLDAPAPPMRASAEIVETARRSTRRRATLAAAGSAFSILLVLVGALLVVREGVAVNHPTAPVTGIGTTAPTPPRPPMPTMHDMDTRLSRIADMLGAAVPPGLVAGTPDDRIGWAMQLHGGEYTNSVRRTMIAADGSGSLEVHFTFNSPFTGDPCTPAGQAEAAQILEVKNASCEVVPISGVPIQVVRGDGVVAATRFLAGGFVTVVSRQETLASPPLAAAQVAALAANPELLH